MSEEQNTAARQVAERIKRYVDGSEGDEIAVRVIERFITEGMSGHWQPCATPPPHDGVNVPLFLVSRFDSFPRRVYYMHGWRDERGNQMENLHACYWIELPPLPERHFDSLAALRDAFIVNELPESL